MRAFASTLTLLLSLTLGCDVAEPKAPASRGGWLPTPAAQPGDLWGPCKGDQYFRCADGLVCAVALEVPGSMCVSPNPATCGGIVGLFDLQGVKTAVTVAPDEVACVVPCDNDCAAFGMACDDAHDICVWAL